MSSSIHVLDASGQTSVLPEEQVLQKLQQGLLKGENLAWKEGMESWQPLFQVLPPPSAPAGSAPAYPVTQLAQPAPGAAYGFVKDPWVLTKALKVMLWVYLGVEVISSLSDLGQLSLASGGDISVEAAEANDARQGIIGMLYLIVFITTGVLFLRWIHRANRNCHGFGAQGMRFTPGWSIGGYFIPFLNLVQPYQAMKEIWQVSTDPKRWQAQAGGALLGWWWALWLLTNFLGNMVFRTSMDIKDAESLQLATTVSLISSLADIPLSIVAVCLVSRIMAKQARLTQSGV